MKLCRWVAGAWCLMAYCAAAAAEEPLVLPTLEVSVTTGNEVQAGVKQRTAARFAGGTVEFELPRGWTVKEVPLGREIRLLASPKPLPLHPHELARGCWLAYQRYVPSTTPRPRLEEELRTSLPKAPDAGTLIGQPRVITVGGYRALRQNVELAGDRGTSWIRRASHVVVQTPWGLLELHGIAPVDVEDDVRAGLNLVLSSLQFFPPRPPSQPNSPDAADAQPALGHWKGQHVRLQLMRDGHVVLEVDPLVATARQMAEPAQGYEPGARLTGRFTAEDDLIFVTWNDGGRLHYRWKVHQGDLFLLDHSGRFSRLKRLFDAPEPEEAPPYAASNLPSPAPGRIVPE